MISKSVTRLALATALVLSSSCASSHHSESGAAVRAEQQPVVHSSQPTASTSGPAAPEYVEVEVAPKAPPAKPETRTAAPSPSHVWISGAHTRHEGTWKWESGHWAVPPRDDVVWVPGHWVSHLRGYVWIAGGWR